MQSVILKKPGGLNQIKLTDTALPPAPGAGEISVAIKAGSLNYHDLLVAAGNIETEDNRVLLSDGAGVVEAVGEGVTEFAVGDHVVSTFFPSWLDGTPHAQVGNFRSVPGDGVDGMAAQRVTRSVFAFTKAPKGWTHAEAATITTAGVTAWRALVCDGGLKAGDTVLTLGTGGVSIAAIQIAKMFGAKVIATSSSDEKLARTEAMGADAIINYQAIPEWGKHVLDLTDNRGADHIIEVGGPQTLQQSITAVAVGGHISLIGVLTGFQGEVPTASLMFKQARLQGLIVGNRRQQQEYVAALEQADALPIIDKTFKYADLAEAFAYQQSGSHFGKIAVEW